MAVDELHKTWAKLDQLERQERYLVERLSDIRREIKAQKLKIDDLAKGRPPAINHLPTELLSQIFTHCIPDPKFPEKPLHQIVGVSRRWRDVVWNNPSFWTFIKVTSDRCEKRLKEQLKRSHKAFLDIWIGDWYCPMYVAYDKFYALLDTIVPHVNRWRSLIISDCGTSLGLVEIVLRVFNHLDVPFLREFTDNFDDLPYPDFLSPTHAPALQHLTLRSPFQLDNFVAPPTLKTLRLAFPETDGFPPVISMLTPAQSLTSLELDGGGAVWSLKRNDLHSPLFEELTLSLNKPVPFLEAIVAPKLRYVQCRFSDPVELDIIEGKFRDVYDLDISFSRSGCRVSSCISRGYAEYAYRHRRLLSSWLVFTDPGSWKDDLP